jgi:putative transcriptional regulator
MENKLREIMKEQGRTQKWLSQTVGVSETTISSYMKNKSIPTLPVALRIANALGKSVEDIWAVE